MCADQITFAWGATPHQLRNRSNVRCAQGISSPLLTPLGMVGVAEAFRNSQPWQADRSHTRTRGQRSAKARTKCRQTAKEMRRKATPTSGCRPHVHHRSEAWVSTGPCAAPSRCPKNMHPGSPLTTAASRELNAALRACIFATSLDPGARTHWRDERRGKLWSQSIAEKTRHDSRREQGCCGPMSQTCELSPCVSTPEAKEKQDFSDKAPHDTKPRNGAFALRCGPR